MKTPVNLSMLSVSVSVPKINYVEKKYWPFSLKLGINVRKNFTFIFDST